MLLSKHTDVGHGKQKAEHNHWPTIAMVARPEAPTTNPLASSLGDEQGW